MPYDSAFYEANFMNNNNRATTSNTASTMHRILFVLFSDSDDVNKPIFFTISVSVAFIFYIKMRGKKLTEVRHNHMNYD